MFNSGILDVAIGLIFIYLLLSLVCTAINEMIEARLKMRAVDLERGIRELLGNGQKTNLVKDFYSHPLIFGLFAGDYKQGQVNAKTQCYARGSNLPSYIPSRNFALALMDILLPANSTTPSGAAGATAAPMTRLNSPDPSGAAGASVSPQSLVAVKPLQPLRNAISGIDNAQIKGALLPLVDAAGDDVSKARENIEAWYDSAMDRVSGWYKRRAQWIILCLGLGLAIAVNADTITIGAGLYLDSPMRNAIVATAQDLARSDPSPSTLKGTAATPQPPPAYHSNKEAIENICKNNKDAPICKAAGITPALCCVWPAWKIQIHLHVPPAWRIQTHQHALPA